MGFLSFIIKNNVCTTPDITFTSMWIIILMLLKLKKKKTSLSLKHSTIQKSF